MATKLKGKKRYEYKIVKTNQRKYHLKILFSNKNWKLFFIFFFYLILLHSTKTICHNHVHDDVDDDENVR